MKCKTVGTLLYICGIFHSKNAKEKNNLEKWGGGGVGGSRGSDLYIIMADLHCCMVIVVWQKLSQHCKAIFLQVWERM